MHFFENIFPLIVIYVIWRIFARAQKSVPREDGQQPPRKAAAGSAADAGPQPSINLRELLLGVLTGQVESSGQTVPRPQAPVQYDEPLEASYWQGYDQGWQKPQPVLEPAASAVRPTAQDKKNVLAATVRPDVAAESALQPARKPGNRFCRSRRQLREAVVWAEILAKPVALRDGD